MGMTSVAEPVESPLPTRERVAAALEEVASLLEAQGANPFRVGAYRGAARTVRGLDRPIEEVVEREGVSGLLALPGIGESLARSIERLVRTGRLGLLERLRGEAQPGRTLATVPGIGPALASRIHDQLGIDGLEELEVAAHDGRLAKVPGMGPRRVQAVRESLAGRFRRPPVMPERLRPPRAPDEPPVADILDVDREYREKAAARRLPRIAPRRFNPTGEAWLPVLHTVRGDQHYTALYSNTARAHELGTTHDWVVVYRDDHGGHGQWTIITSRLGVLRGKRIVRGRESECREHYARSGGA
jgi:hypothetical protein